MIIEFIAICNYESWSFEMGISLQEKRKIVAVN
jgi:hypothetical protein